MIPTIRVLYVEDDRDWREIIQNGISSLGYQLEFASTSKEAMFKLKRSTYHVALLDKRLDEDDPENEEGLSVATVIAGLDEGTKIIVYTSYGNIEDAREAFRKIKVRDFIGKAKPISEIINAIKESGEEASLEFRRPTRTAAEILTAKGNILDQFLSKFPSKSGLTSNAQNLELFAKRLLGEFRPLLPDQSSPKLLTISRVSILQIRFWSKMLGFPIASWFGAYHDMKTVLEKIDLDGDLQQSLGINNKINELFDVNVFSEYGGAVFELINTELDEFVSPMKIHS